MATRATSRGPVPADRRRAAPKPGADSAAYPDLAGTGAPRPDGGRRCAPAGPHPADRRRQPRRDDRPAAGRRMAGRGHRRARPGTTPSRKRSAGSAGWPSPAWPAGPTSAFKGGDSEHTTEAADHRAIVLVPQGFSPKDPVDVLLYFHGHTEVWRGRYAGLRQRTFTPTAATRKAGLTSDNKVRDVDLDQIEQQMDSSGKRQTIGILAQGGPQHQFGDINVDAYISDVLTRTNKEYPTILTEVPKSWSVILSGHSGGGFAVQDALSAKNKPKNLKGLLLFDAEAMQRDMRQRITEDLDFLADPTSHRFRPRHPPGRTPIGARVHQRRFPVRGQVQGHRHRNDREHPEADLPGRPESGTAAPADPAGDPATHRGRELPGSRSCSAAGRPTRPAGTNSARCAPVRPTNRCARPTSPGWPCSPSRKPNWPR